MVELHNMFRICSINPFFKGAFVMSSTTVESGSKVIEDVFQNIRRAAEANLKMQQEVFHQWSHLWPFPTPQSVWIDKVRDFQKQWASTVSELVRKHRSIVDRQYQAVIESLDAAFHVVESTNPEEFRRRTEQLCRKAIDCVRETSETQLREFQSAVAKWTEMATKGAT
jgi:hypothetical protein